MDSVSQYYLFRDKKSHALWVSNHGPHQYTYDPKQAFISHTLAEAKEFFPLVKADGDWEICIIETTISIIPID